MSYTTQQLANALYRETVALRRFEQQQPTGLFAYTTHMVDTPSLDGPGGTQAYVQFWNGAQGDLLAGRDTWLPED